MYSDRPMSFLWRTATKNDKHTRKSTQNITRKTRKNAKGPTMNCHPAIDGKTAAKDTCFTPDILLKIKSDYNHTHRDDPIQETDPQKIIKELRQRLSSCEKEDCWLRQLNDDKLRKRIYDYVFAPKHPKEWKYNPNEWLSNYDIFNVLTQYEDKYPEFEFIGPSFIDFDAPINHTSKCVTDELCQFSLKSHLEKKHRKIAVIFNLDKHTGPGTHWVSLFIDLDKNKPFIFYFDSAGDKIPPEIMRLVKRIKQQGKHLNKPIRFKFYENYPMTHQYSNTECGMYSLFFVITLLVGSPDSAEAGAGKKGGTFDKIRFFRRHRIPDKFAENLRWKYFND